MPAPKLSEFKEKYSDENQKYLRGKMLKRSGIRNEGGWRCAFYWPELSFCSFPITSVPKSTDGESGLRVGEENGMRPS